jgi:hypothetical protein
MIYKIVYIQNEKEITLAVLQEQLIPTLMTIVKYKLISVSIVED